MAHFKEYKFFRSFSARVEGWSLGRAEKLWRRLRERKIAEIEAAEACRWMRAAGFPQYAQMYADQQFPVDLHAVQKDHPFLDKDALQALFRRLHALNKCARLQRIDGPAAAAAAAHNTERGEGVGGGDSDEEVECALSDNWMFLHQSRRWSRVSPLTEQPSPLLHRAAGPQPVVDTDLPECETEVGQADDLTDLTRVQNQLPLQRQHSSSLPPGKFKTLPTEMEAEFSSPQPFRRSGSEKLRDGAKAFLRRVESLKSRGKKAKVGCRSDEMPKIGSPQVIDVESMQERMRTLNCVELNSPEALEAGGTSHPSTVFDNANNNNNNLLFPEKEDTGAHSDSECLDRSAAWMESEEKGKQPEEKRKKKEPGKRPRKLQTKEQRSATLNLDIKIKPNKAGSKFGKSDNGGLASLSPDKEESRTSSFYEQLRRGAFARRHKELSKGSSEGSIHEEESTPSPSKKALTRWHSFGRGCAMRRPSTLPQQLAPLGGRRKGVPLASLSCGQLMVLRQLAMLKLTAMMEKHCPSLRSTGFSWELPKFMRKTGKSSQPKEGALFGVSLIACLQATGQALPKPIQAAIKHLAEHALDRVGIFRKPGVKSRIQKLRQHLISLGADEPLELALEEQQDYDVADLVKQFFRELPEALMTTKLSDTFLAIFQHVPLINRHEAMKWAVILLPDQHREVLQLLLAFLGLVASHSRHNQMTASNLAVCFAPSLFHPSGPLVSASIDSPDSASGSPRTRNSKRAKGNGSPDARELSETRAGHDCLLYLINHHEELVRVSHELLNQCHFSSLEQSIPVPLDELGTDLSQDWRGYMGACTAALLKEVKERSRGWVSVASHHQQVDLAYKKVGDGHPLRLWRATTEVEAPPAEVLNRIIREQFAWDPTLAKARVLARLESHTEVYQFANHSMRPLAPRDFTTLRTWKSDLPRGGFVLVETSVEHGLSTEPLVPGAIRGIVLASRYLIEHCGSGRSRIVHLARVDTKGRSVEWYNKCYGQMCALRLSRVRGSFAQYLNSEGPESKV